MPATDFVTSTARIAALSDRLLSLSDVERMLSATDANEAARVLNDLSWGGALADASNPEDFEAVIDAGLFETKTVLMHSSPSYELLEYLFLPFDLQNAKTSLAAFGKKLKYEDIRADLSDLSLFPKRTAFEVLEGAQIKKPAGFFFEKALIEAAEILQKNPEDIEHAQLTLDIAFTDRISSAVDVLSSSALSAFFKKQVEAQNIKRIVRRGSDQPGVFLAPGAGIPGLSFGISHEAAQQKLNSSSLKPFLDEGIGLVSEGADLFNWEVRLEMTLLESLFWPARSNPTSVENLVLFFLTKLRNSEVIRMILVGKKNRFSNEDIRGLITPFIEFLPKK